jgi:uncharacterized protein (DUF736 family)
MNDYQKPFETKNFTGALFRNDKKETDQHPDYRGSTVLEGKEYWVSAWINTSAKGVKYMALKYSEKEAVHNAGMAQAQAAVVDDGFKEDADVPF